MELKKPVQICLPKLAGVVDEKAKHGRPRLDDPELSTYVIYIYAMVQNWHAKIH